MPRRRVRSVEMEGRGSSLVSVWRSGYLSCVYWVGITTGVASFLMTGVSIKYKEYAHWTMLIGEPEQKVDQMMVSEQTAESQSMTLLSRRA